MGIVSTCLRYSHLFDNRYENVTSGEGGDNVTVELVTVLEEVLDVLTETEVIAMETTPMTIVGSNDESIEYVIPDRMVVTMEPREEVCP